jgi:hypothetical protein
LGGLPVYGYQAWAVRRGLIAWSALWGAEEGRADETAVASPPWRRMCPLIVISFVALAGRALVGGGDPILAASAR